MEAIRWVNWLAVLVATVLGFGLGAIWYNTRVFGTRWVTSVGRPMDQMGKPAEAMTVTFITTLIGALGLALLVAIIPMVGWMPGLKLGLFCGVCFAGATQISDGAYQGRSWEGRLIDAGYRVVMFAVMGAVIGAWR